MNLRRSPAALVTRLAGLFGLVLCTWFAGPARVAASDLVSTLTVRGTLDVTGHGRSEALDLDGTAIGDSPYDPYRLRLFTEAQVAPGIQVYAQSLLDESHYELAEGAYVMFTPWEGRDAHLLAGKIPFAIGTWEPRSYSNKNPLIGAPLLYSYYTSLVPWAPAFTADAQRAKAGGGWMLSSIGMTTAWDGWWDAGVMAQGSAHPIEYALAATQGTPSAPAPGRDPSPGNGWSGRLGVAPTAGLRLGVSGATGPYLPDGAAYAVPAGHEVKDYRQDLLMSDFEWQGGRIELRGEGALNAWGTPSLGTLRVRSGYAELRAGLGAAAWFAARVEGMRFSHFATSTGDAPWDDDVDRVEAGLGYRLDRNALVKLVYQRYRVYEPAEPRVYDLAAVQLALSF